MPHTALARCGSNCVKRTTASTTASTTPNAPDPKLLSRLGSPFSIFLPEPTCSSLCTLQKECRWYSSSCRARANHANPSKLKQLLRKSVSVSLSRALEFSHCPSLPLGLSTFIVLVLSSRLSLQNRSALPHGQSYRESQLGFSTDRPGARTCR